jgi:RecB family endonuclease NucS
VVIEIKKPAGKLAHVDQLRRYVSYFERDEAETWTVRGILVAPEIGKIAKRTLRDHDLEGVELTKFSRPELSPSATTLDEFWNKGGSLLLSRLCRIAVVR